MNQLPPNLLTLIKEHVLTITPEYGTWYKNMKKKYEPKLHSMKVWHQNDKKYNKYYEKKKNFVKELIARKPGFKIKQNPSLDRIFKTLFVPPISNDDKLLAKKMLKFGIVSYNKVSDLKNSYYNSAPFGYIKNIHKYGNVSIAALQEVVKDLKNDYRRQNEIKKSEPLLKILSKNNNTTYNLFNKNTNRKKTVEKKNNKEQRLFNGPLTNGLFNANNVPVKSKKKGNNNNTKNNEE